jgi:hypothetical protein
MNLLAATAAADATKVAFDLPPDYIAAAALIMGATVLVSLASGIVTIWDRTRKKPSLQDDLDSYRHEANKIFATKDELGGVELRISRLLSTEQIERRESIVRVEAKLADLQRSIEGGFKELQRSLGRVEGKLEKD